MLAAISLLTTKAAIIFSRALSLDPRNYHRPKRFGHVFVFMSRENNEAPMKYSECTGDTPATALDRMD